MRERARQQLGPKFDLKTFHDEILSGGALPLDLLEARVDRWIKAQMVTAASMLPHGVTTPVMNLKTLNGRPLPSECCATTVPRT